MTREDVEVWHEIEAVLEDLQMIYEQMQTLLEASELLQDRVLQQNQQLADRHQYYYDLFQSAPIAFLVIDADGVILEANQAIAKLLQVPQPYLVGKPLILYLAEADRSLFRTRIKQLCHNPSHETNDLTQAWQINLRPRNGQLLPSEWQIAIARNDAGTVESLRIGVVHLSQSQQAIAPLAQLLSLEAVAADTTRPMPQLPQSLDGLQVLVVDDEADTREFIRAVLESHNIGVKAVGSAAAALKALEQFHPDVLLSDIRMPQQDGYSLIRQIRALEASRGGHIPSAAITAYLDEDGEKALRAGFETHLHKLAPPSQWVEIVAQLARQASSQK